MTDNQPPAAHSLESLYRDYGRQVFRAALRITGSSSDAEDALQTVFVRLARQGHVARLGKHPGPYLQRAGTNAALDLLRRRKTAAPVDLDDAESELLADRRDRPDLNLKNADLSSALREAIAGLSDRMAEVFVLRYIEGLTNPAIAAELGTSAGVVAVTLHRARKSVIETMHRHGIERQTQNQRKKNPSSDAPATEGDS